MQSEVVQAAAVARHGLGRLIDHLITGEATAHEVLLMADELDELARALRVRAGTMHHHAVDDGT